MPKTTSWSFSETT